MNLEYFLCLKVGYFKRLKTFLRHCIRYSIYTVINCINNFFFIFLAAVRRKFPDSNEKQIKVRIGCFLAQSSDRDGGRKRRSENNFRNESLLTVENSFSELNKTF